MNERCPICYPEPPEFEFGSVVRELLETNPQTTRRKLDEARQFIFDLALEVRGEDEGDTTFDIPRSRWIPRLDLTPQWRARASVYLTAAYNQLAWGEPGRIHMDPFGWVVRNDEEHKAWLVEHRLNHTQDDLLTGPYPGNPQAQVGGYILLGGLRENLALFMGLEMYPWSGNQLRDWAQRVVHNLGTAPNLAVDFDKNMASMHHTVATHLLDVAERVRQLPLQNRPDQAIALLKNQGGSR